MSARTNKSHAPPLCHKKTVMRVKSMLMAALGSLKDQAAIGRATVDSGNVLSGIDIAILRSTDPSNVPLDDKYVHEILFMISNAPGSITFLARRISSRLEMVRDPVVALKTLLLLHRLLRGGDRYFEQDLRNLWSSGELRIDLSWLLGDSETLSSFILHYSKFLGERKDWIINQAGKLEPIRLLSDSGGFQSYEEKTTELVLYRLSKSQAFLDRIVDCLPANNSRSSYVIQSAMNVVLRESFRVYESFCEGVEIVVSSFFDLKKTTRVLAIDILRKACIQTSNLHEFYEHCKKCIVGKSLDYPSVRIITTADISSMDRLVPTEYNLPDSTISRNREESTVQEAAGGGSYETWGKLFSQRLETKISTVWVEFDEKDSQSSSFSSVGVADDLITELGDQSSMTGKAMELL